ncbi:MAG: 5'/3'-nucleotidase SurE [Planctomycetia bacterium]|nr:5'/3'-nucleotidase SurE [Planctomycetia bacterium]
MLILLTNDDGIFAPGLAAIYNELKKMGEVYIVAPALEQSGVSQSLTFRTPLVVKDVFINDKRWGWGVEGSPADCVKIGVNVVCPRKPDIIVSGINWGQNGGTNILYSGTLGAARDGGLMGIPSFALSVEDVAAPNFVRAAEISRELMVQILRQMEKEKPSLDVCGNPVPHIYNINMATEALEEENPEILVAPMDTTPYGNRMEERSDTFGRAYYWFVPNRRERRPECLTDMNALGQNKIVVTPLQFDMTNHAQCAVMQQWGLKAPTSEKCQEASEEKNFPKINMRTCHNGKAGRFEV